MKSLLISLTLLTSLQAFSGSGDDSSGLVLANFSIQINDIISEREFLDIALSPEVTWGNSLNKNTNVILAGSGDDSSGFNFSMAHSQVNNDDAIIDIADYSNQDSAPIAHWSNYKHKAVADLMAEAVAQATDSLSIKARVIEVANNSLEERVTFEFNTQGKSTYYTAPAKLINVHLPTTANALEASANKDGAWVDLTYY